MKVSEFLNENTQISPLVLGAFLNHFIVQNDYIYTYSHYKHQKNKFVTKTDYENSIKIYVDLLNLQCGENYWKKNNTKFICSLENDLSLSKNEFYSKLLRKIFLSDFFLDNELTENKKQFIRGFFEMRGSVDTTRPLLAQDYFYNSQEEIKRVRYLSDNFCIPEEELNFNFRELQNQFVTGINKRNTQLRINLFWYLNNIRLINPYKAEKAKNAYDLPATLINNIYYFDCPTQTHNASIFTERVNFYLNSIFKQELSEREIEKLRNELEFNKDIDEKEFSRDSNIIRFMRLYTVDECSACKKYYPLKDRSFQSKPLNGRYYTEIHHVISVGKDKDLDVLENLAKLCPVCHRALKRGAANEEYQKFLIKEILQSNPQNLEFAQIVFENSNQDFLCEKIWANLK